MEKLILMSIKTKYANQIFDKTKVYEYRRRSIGEKNLNKKIYIYSSEEEKAIVGYIIVDKIIEGTSKYVLEATGSSTKIDIINYFKGCNKCYALKINEAVRFKTPINLAEIRKVQEKFVIPQYYRYIYENEPLYKLLGGNLLNERIPNR